MTPPAGFESGEYEPVQAGDGMAVLSWVFFLAALASRWFTGWVPDIGLPRTFIPALTTPALALLGVLVAFVGSRFGRRRSALARVGLFLNTAVLLLSGLAAVIFVWILGR